METPDTVHFLGTPCKYGHTGLRYTRSKSCVQCVHDRAVAYRLSNVEELRAYEKQWRADHKAERRVHLRNNASYYRRKALEYQARKQQKKLDWEAIQMEATRLSTHD